MDYLFVFVAVFLIILLAIAGILLYDYIKAAIKRMDIESENLLADTARINSLIEYNEEKIISHLEYIVSEAIAEYELYNITPDSLYYINSKRETEMLDYVKEAVNKRISPTLINKLSYIYDPSYIGEFIANYIYLKVTETVVDFNNSNDSANAG
jgi:hypothetical protein